MNHAETIFSHLPAYLRNLPAARRGLLTEQLRVLEAPMAQVSKDLAAVFESLTEKKPMGTASIEKEPHWVVWGVHKLGWSGDVVRAVGPILAWYLERRGTRLGIEGVLASIFGTRDFEIFERTFPLPGCSIGDEWPPTAVLVPEQDGSSSVTIRVPEVGTEALDAARIFLKAELPFGVRSYFVKESSHATQSP